MSDTEKMIDRAAHEAATRYLDRKSAAKFLTDTGFPTAQRQLEKLACLGGGPVYRLYGRRALYSPSDLIAWAEARTSAPRSHTSEASANAA
jgi:hypothetical protein